MSLRDQLSSLVYSTETGRIDPEKDVAEAPKGDGIVRIHRETKGRKGKGVTLIKGLELSLEDMKVLAKQLKQRCGVGGSVKDFVIEIQGDQREACKKFLEEAGYRVKLAGG